MRSLKRFIWITALLGCFGAWAQVGRPAKCEAFGAVYFTKTKSEADFIVFIEESEGLATLKVFKVDNILYASGPGLWYETQAKSQARYLVYIETERKSAADFTVAYVTQEAYAGCE